VTCNAEHRGRFLGLIFFAVYGVVSNDQGHECVL